MQVKWIPGNPNFSFFLRLCPQPRESRNHFSEPLPDICLLLLLQRIAVKLAHGIAPVLVDPYPSSSDSLAHKLDDFLLARGDLRGVARGQGLRAGGYIELQKTIHRHAFHRMISVKSEIERRGQPSDKSAADRAPLVSRVKRNGTLWTRGEDCKIQKKTPARRWRFEKRNSKVLLRER